MGGGKEALPKGRQVAVAELGLPAGLSLEACWPRGGLLMPSQHCPPKSVLSAGQAGSLSPTKESLIPDP